VYIFPSWFGRTAIVWLSNHQQLVARTSHPMNSAGARRKLAWGSAWQLAIGLKPGMLAKALRIGRSLAAGYASPDRHNQPSAKQLAALARVMREHASRLIAEADRLELIAADTDEA
jgi:hypothetical protein